MLNTISGMLGGGAAPTDYESIQTVTVGAGGASSVTFSSIPSTYTHLQIRATIRNTNVGPLDNVILRFNSDTGTNYNWHQIDGNGSSATSAGEATVNYLLIGLYPGAGAASNTFGSTVADILDYANTNKFKTARGLSGFDTNSAGEIVLRSGAWRNTNAITSIDITGFAGNFVQYSSFALYGIK